MRDVLEGLRTFQRDAFPKHRSLFERLYHNQDPRCLFITCSDSRVVPNLILQADPGELFIIRNAGNIVPPYGEGGEGVLASIEYAVEALGVRDIVLCGHTNCGAMKGILHPEKVAGMPNVANWCRHGEAARLEVEQQYPGVDDHEKMERMVEQNVILQVRNLLTHPSVRAGVEKGAMELYGWVYDILTGHMKGLDETGRAFVDLHLDEHGSPDEKRMLLEMEAVTSEEPESGNY